MRTSLRLPLLLLALLAGAARGAEGAAQPSLRLRLDPDQPAYWAGQRVRCTLELDLAGAELGGGGRLSVGGIPESGASIDVGPFAPAAPSAPGRRAWASEVSLLAPGTAVFEPSVSGTLQRPRPGNTGFFRQYSIEGFSASADPRRIVARPLPEEGRPADFCNAVGSFVFDASLAPRECAPGDLLTLRWTLHGRGAELGREVAWDPGPGFKAYPPRVEERGDGLLSVSQVVVPLSTNAVSAAPFAVSVFDPAASRYETHRAGPFALRFVERAPVEEDPVPAIPAPAPGKAAPTTTVPEAGGAAAAPGDRLAIPALAPARLAPAAGAKVLFEIPAGTAVRVREVRGAWLRVLLPDGSSGWISSPSP